MAYVDGFVLAVATERKDEYQRFAQRMAPMFRRHGALSVVECWGDDVPGGELTSFPLAVQCADDETVVFAWITWPDKETRDTGTKRVMEEAEASGEQAETIPFDGKRMIFGGFRTIVEA